MQKHLALCVLIIVAMLLVTGDRTLRAAARPNEKDKEQEKAPKIDPKAFYECLLGAYFSDGKPVPFINLAIPDKNLLTEDVKEKMRGRFSMGEMSYKATGYIVITKPGVYEFDQSFGDVKINGHALGLDHKKGSSEMPKGTFPIEVSVGSHGQPYINQAKISIHLKGDEATKIPILNNGRDVQRFVTTLIAGAPPVLVTPFNPDEHKVEIPKAK